MAFWGKPFFVDIAYSDIYYYFEIVIWIKYTYSYFIFIIGVWFYMNVVK